MEKCSYPAKDWQIDRRMISAHALSVVQVLQNNGHDGYLVGGCVRDLIMGLKPKDFDVVTDASPERVRSLFRSARIIGRRFKIVHVPTGRGRQREIVEVSTYRVSPDDTLDRHSRNPSDNVPHRIRSDNFYGRDIRDDVQRRDFTVNSLYYAPLSEQIIDFTQGIKDIETRTLRVIGDTRTRFIEDPVRILRAVRFQSKLGLHVPQEISRCIEQCAHNLLDIPPARLFDESLKLLQYGFAELTWQNLDRYYLLQYLFPDVQKSIQEDAEGKTFTFIKLALENTDKRVLGGLPIMPAFLFAIFLWFPVQKCRNDLIGRGKKPHEALWESVDRVFHRQNQTLPIPWRVRSPIQEIWGLQYQLQRRSPKAIEKILVNRRFRAAYDFMLIRQKIGEIEQQLVEWWTDIQQSDSQQRVTMISALRPELHRASERRKPRKKTLFKTS